MKTRDEIRDDLPLYALGALDAEERAAVVAALATDAELGRELRQWTEVVGLMALDAPDVAPPDIKTKLLARVHGGALASDKVARRRLGGWMLPVAAAATALLAIAGYREIGFRAERERAAETLVALQRGLVEAKGDLAKVSATLAQSQSDANALRIALARAEESLSVVQQRDLQMVALKETKDAPPAVGHVLLSPPTGKALFYAFDLPNPPPDKVYELWWITEKDGPVRAAIFHPDAGGIGRAEATMPKGAGAIHAAAVTLEAAGGVPKPQGPMVLLGTL
ncbi:MAG: anti-sigma factor [bacterium]